MTTVEPRPGCPMVGGVPFDPIRPDQVLNPHPWLKLARSETPVFYMVKYDAWCVTRYGDVLEVLKDTEKYSSQNVIEPQYLPGLEDSLPGGHPMRAGLVNTDPPEHTRLRKLAQQAFTPKMVAAFEPKARSMADELIDAVIADGRMELIHSFSRELTGKTITAVIGADPSKAPDFAEWSDNLLMSLADAPPVGPEREPEMIEQVLRFHAWLVSFLEDRRANPREDYASFLVHAKSDDGSPALETSEAIGILTNVISAGLDTTSSLIGLALFNLLKSRDRWERLVADPSLVPQTIEETLRYDAPLHGIRRDVLADVEISGVAIPKGSVLYLSYSSAQRDESVFSTPDVFDIDRTDVGKHFALGKWRHFCLGAPLARMEAIVALETLIDRIPSLRLADGATPHAVESRLGAFLTELQLEWDVS
jgi:cytochrome P450